MLSPLAGRPDQATTTHRLDEVLGEYLEAVESGRAPNRQEFLAAHPDLAAQLEVFLADQDRFDALLAPLGSSAGNSGRDSRRSSPTGSDVRPGQVLGNYELVEEIARGGMGVVFKARQFLSDSTPRSFRVVALKMLAESSWGSAADVQRFRLEASAVAHLDHPNIVPLYDVGEHEAAPGRMRPFFSMKLVEGGSLARQVGRFKGRPRDAARLIVRVARAVDYAHQRGIIHRDLKPGNILLEGRPDGPPDQLRPLVADFGLAKRLRVGDSSPPEQTLPSLTQRGTAVGTPAYMPPEQALGEVPVTTAADVYSLGAILYELLAGRPPFRMPTGLGTLLEVLDREPDPPSKHCPGLGRDLEVICLKCLRKDPSRRYPGAAALADDLDRYLNGEPIQARPASAREKALKWCRRHPVPAVVVLFAVFAVFGLVAAASWYAQHERRRADTEAALRQQADEHAAEEHRQRERADRMAAEEKRQRAAADEGYQDAHKIVSRFCVRLSENELSNIPGLQPLRKEMLEEGLKYLQKFARRKADDPRLRNEIADTHFRIGLLTNIVGAKQDAIASYRRALALYRDLHKTTSDQRLMISRTLNNLANLLGDVGRGGEAADARQESHDLVEALGREKPNDPEVQKSLVVALNSKAGWLESRGKPRAALDVLLRGRGITQQLLVRRPDQREYHRDLAISHVQEGHFRKALRDPARVLPCYQEARKILEKLIEAEGDSSWLRLDLSRVYRYLASEYRSRGQNVESLALLERSRTTCMALVRANRQVPVFRQELALVLSQMASLHLATAQPDRALECYQQALALLRILAAHHPELPRIGLELAQACHNVGTTHRELKQPADALRAFQESKLLFEQLVARQPRNAGLLDYLAGTVNSLADALQKLDRREEALKSFEDGARHSREALALAPNHLGYRRTLSSLLGNLARAHRLAKRPDKAVVYSLERRKLWLGDAEQVYQQVREFVLAAQLVEKDAPTQRKYYDLALETLDLALQTGYKDFNNLRNNPRLGVLRQRPEFQRLLREFERKNR